MSNEEKLLDHLKWVTGELRAAKQRLREVESAEPEPIAIVGMACRYPGGARSPEDLWRLVAEGADVISTFPADRGWDLDALFDPDPEHPGTSYVREGGFLYDAGEFDAGFFGISPREALAMDPQQRLLLETAWEAIEQAGLDKDDLDGSDTGVYTGVSSHDYLTLISQTSSDVEGYIGTGNLGSVSSGRISYTFGLEGPAVTVDTACSSSLVSIHMACQALREGDCTLALAGGATVMATPGAFTEFSRQRGLAQDGRCKPFAAASDGTGWGEGVGMIVLERLSDARRHGRRVLALVRGSAVNQDGQSNGLTAPNGPSQERVIRQALANARLSATEVDAVEAHGTGTTLGDPIEAGALLATYGRNRPADKPLWLGSVKSNIGHTQAAAGVAGVIKMVMAMRHGLLPASLHIDEPTPHVDWGSGGVRLLTEATEWAGGEDPRRAAVSAFGISGTNAHVILEQAPAPAPAADGADETTGVLPWVLSARGGDALRAQARALAECAAEARPADIGWSLATTRSALEYRAVVAGHDRDALLSGLAALAAGEAHPAVVSPGTPVAGGAGPVLVFPGQGSQWAGMGAELLDTSPVFAARIAECEQALTPHVEWSLTDILRGGDMTSVDVIQPVLWAVMVSLAALWAHHGVKPAAVVGHSQGEIAAACVAGALSLEDAAKVVALRSRALRRLAGGGAMASLGVDEERALELIGDSDVTVAAVNGPGSTVISGPPGQVEAVVAAAQAADLRARMIDVDYASHGPQVEEIRGELAETLAGIAAVGTDVAFYSTVTGSLADPAELDAGYWFTNLRRPVRFADAVHALLDDGHRLLIEASPHPVLTIGMQETFEQTGADAVTVPTLRRDEGGLAQFTQSAALAYAAGARVDWTRWFSGAHTVELPTYAFQRQRYWVDPPARTSRAAGGQDAAEARLWDAIEGDDLDTLAATLRLEGDDAVDALRPALPILAGWHRGHREETTVNSWRYQATWKRLPETVPAGLTGAWFVLFPAEFEDHPAVRVTLQTLHAHGAAPVPHAVDTAGVERQALAERLTELIAEESPGGVVSLLALDERPHPDHPAVPAGLAATVTLLQALHGVSATAPLYCVTQGAAATTPGESLPNPAQTQTWGLGRIAALEHPKLWGGLIDLPPSIDHRTAGRLAALLHPDNPEDQAAVRATGVLARRLTRAPVAAAPAHSWEPHGTTLITGGTGGIGAHLARWLARRGADHLLLLSRRGPDAPGADELTAELTELGTTVTVTACDAADRDQVKAAIDAIPAEHPLTSVIHAAGVPNYVAINDLTVARLGEVLAPKAYAAAHLHELTRDLDLAAFVLFSSGAASWGSGQQAAYGAANTYLDALAEHRHGQGLPATSIAWGPWSEAGMAADQESLAFFSRFGLNPMPPGPATQALHLAVSNGDTALTVANFNWEQFTPTFTAQRPSPLLEDIPENRATGERAQAAPEANTPLHKELASASPGRRHHILLKHIQKQAATTLGHATADAIPAAKPFQELGFDSLTAVKLRNDLNASTGLRLPTTLIFDHPTPQDLAGFIQSQLSDGPSATAGATVAAASDEPIAIVGMACQYPGGVRTPEELWELVAGGVDAIGAFPSDRGWDLDTLFDADPDHVGTSYVREGGFVHDAADFDAGFFGISPREATSMDPQQRLLLETAWRAVEHAGLDRDALGGSNTGVFTGLTIYDYLALVGQRTADVEGYIGTGNLGCVASGRVSYTLDLIGPAVTVDTGCSSSLVAMHLACQALRQGECTLALAGGATIMSTPGSFVEFSRQRGLAQDGRCKPFAAAADGTGWGEGVGMVVLERLSDARRLGHDVLAVVRGSAMNQDGTSNGLTAPNGPSQERVIRQALANARLSGGEVDVVEAHGTGTTLGDPIEAGALLATYGLDRPAGRPLWLGSVKSNIGHTQAAAGVAGVIKMVMAMRHGVLPASLHVDEPTRHVDWDSGGVRLLTEASEWTADGPRRAGVSAFGISGTNAHLILEEAPEGPPIAPADAPSAGVVPWVLSARTGPALQGQARALADHVAADPELSPADVGWSLVRTRSAFEHRAVVAGHDRDALLAGLTALARGGAAPEVVTGYSAGTGAGAVLVFPGQGSQWAGMGAELLETSPVFAARIAECEQALAPYVDWSLTDILRGAEMTSVDVIQPVLWAVMVSLAAVWAHYGVRPAAVVGHSQGEMAAACVAGALSIRDAAKVVAVRSQALRQLSGQGAMASLGVGRDRAAELTAGSDVTVAAVNGPGSTVISGPPGQVEAVVAAAESAGHRARLIDVDYASHGPHVDRIAAELTERLAGVRPSSSETAFYSTVTGGPIDTAELDAAYWVTNLREPVRFADAIQALLADGYRVFVESSPHPVLVLGMQECFDQAETVAHAVPTLRRNEGGPMRVALSAGQAFAAGVEVEWTGWFPASPLPRTVKLPTYAFQRQRYWLDTPSLRGGDPAGLGLAAAGHPLLGAAVELADGDTCLLTGRLSPQSQTWLAEHRVMGTVLLPGSAMAELAVRAAARTGCDHVADLTLHTPLAIPDDGAVDLQVAVGAPDESGQRPVTVHSRPVGEESAWERHATGLLAAAPPPGEPATLDGIWPPPGATAITDQAPYQELADHGYEYGPASQGLVAAWRLGDDLYAEVALPDEERTRAAGYGVHPVLLDAALHALILDATAGDAGEEDTVLLPFSWSGLRVHATGATTLRVRITQTAPDRLALVAADPTGAPVVTLDALTVRPVPAGRLGGARHGNSLFGLAWLPAASPAPAASPRAAVIAAAGDPVADAVAEALPGAVRRSRLGEVGTPAPEVILAVAVAPEGADPLTQARSAGTEAVALLQEWLDAAELADAQLVVLTRGAVAARDGEDVRDLAGAAVWGLVRSAQTEDPRRLVLLDLDDDSYAAVPAALATGEPQVALRGGQAYVPRLVRDDPAKRPPPADVALDPEGTVLVTGATGALGALTARHLVTRHGVRRLLLASRRGTDAPGAAELAAELAELGAHVDVEACDTGDRAALAALLASVPDAHPLTAVVHTAGIVRDALVPAMTPGQLDEVLHVKADTAWYLHELTRDLDLAAFVLYSSVTGLIGGPGQGSYTAANAFLDALALHRHARGAPATSLAWGYWDLETGMSGRLTDADRARHARAGVIGLTADQGVALLDAALEGGEPLLVPFRLDLAGMRRQARVNEVPAVLRHLVRGAASPSGGATASSLVQKLSGLPPADRERALVELVSAHVGAVLGHDPSAAAIDTAQQFRELGFDSLTAVELRNRLATATGLRLPATVIFDHANPAELARYLLAELEPRETDALAPMLSEVDRLERSLLAVSEDAGVRLALAERLRTTLSRLDAADVTDAAEDAVASRIQYASTEEIFDFIDRELGRAPGLAG